MSELLDKFKKFEDKKSEEKSKIIRPLSSIKDLQKKSSSGTKSISPRKDISILNEENLIRFIQEQERTKPYEMKIRFYKSSSYEIQKLLKNLFQKDLLKRNRNGWISLKEGELK